MTEDKENAEVSELLAEQQLISNEFDEMQAQRNLYLQEAERLQTESTKKMGVYAYLQAKIDALKTPAAEPHLAAVKADEQEAENA